MTIAEMPKVV